MDPERKEDEPEGGRSGAALAARLERVGVRDDRVLEAIRAVPRRGFVPPERASAADRDEPVPIPHGQVTTQPSLVAAMVSALELAGHEKVLEVGTGLGWQTALLARLAGRVWSVERHAALAEWARRNLAAAGVTNVEVIEGDGTRGWPAGAPYDAVLVSAAFLRVPEPLVEQLGEGGRLVQPVGPGGGDEVLLFEKRGGGLRRRRKVADAYFVRLVGEEAFPEEGAAGSDPGDGGPLPGGGSGERRRPSRGNEGVEENGTGPGGGGRSP